MRLRITILTLVAALHAACIGVPPTEVPLPSVASTAAEPRHDSVVIMLPGRGDRAETFVREGFDRLGAQYGFDTIAVDAHFGYYMRRSLVPRLHEDIVLPAREAGYENVWLLGVSMGGYGSLLYASNHPELVDGVILLAPFLGDSDSLDEIAASGGLRDWRADQSGLPDHVIGVWTWLRDTEVPVVLGYGEADGMAGGYRRLLTEILEPAHVYTREGGHKWTTWRPLWQQIAADLQR